MFIRAGFTWALLAIAIPTAKAHGSEKLENVLRSMADSVHAARNKFDAVVVTGKVYHESKVISGKAGLASQGNPSNSRMKGSLHYSHRDFGLTRKIIIVPEHGASPGHESESRTVQTANFGLEVDNLKTGYIRPVEADQSEYGSFMAYFWKPGEDPYELLDDSLRESLKGGDVNVEQSGVLKCYIPLPVRGPFRNECRIEVVGSQGTVLPINFALLENDEVVENFEWSWKETNLGSHYPSKFWHQQRLVYPHKNDAIEIVTTVFEFDEVSEAPVLADETFTFAGLGLGEGAAVYDNRDSRQTRYEYQPSSKNLLGLIEKPLAKEYQAGISNGSKALNWARGLGVVLVFAFAFGCLGFFLVQKSR